jgi:hypothetical protein
MEIIRSRRDPTFELRAPRSSSNQLKVPLSPLRYPSGWGVFPHEILFPPREILGPSSPPKERGGQPFVFSQKVYHKIGPPGSKGKLTRACPPRGVKPQVRSSSIFGTNLPGQTLTQENPTSSIAISSGTSWASELKKFGEVHP